MVGIIDIINVGLFAAALRFATPLVYASLGGVFSERAGIVNVGLEGMMLMGAFSGVLTSFYTGNAWLGVLSAVFTGGLFGLLHGVLTVKFAGNQIVSGTGINLFALGFTAYMSQAIWGSRGASVSVPGIPIISLQFLKDSNYLVKGLLLNFVPGMGDAFNTLFSQSPLVYIMFVVVVISYIVLFKTPLGLRIRAVGEHPAAADTAGVNVYRTKYMCLLASGMLAGLGGVFLSLGILNIYVLNMTGGQGFIALAAMILGRWKPFGALAASFMFGILYALQIGLQSAGWLPPQIIQATPYILTVVVLAGFVRKAKAPSDYKPYEKD
jgi:simple sugar transport system permease protein